MRNTKIRPVPGILHIPNNSKLSGDVTPGKPEKTENTVEFIRPVFPIIPRGRFRGLYDMRKIRCYRLKCQLYPETMDRCDYCGSLPYFGSSLKYPNEEDVDLVPKVALRKEAKVVPMFSRANFRRPSKRHSVINRHVQSPKTSKSTRELDSQLTTLIQELAGVVHESIRGIFHERKCLGFTDNPKSILKISDGKVAAAVDRMKSHKSMGTRTCGFTESYFPKVETAEFLFYKIVTVQQSDDTELIADVSEDEEHSHEDDDTSSVVDFD